MSAVLTVSQINTYIKSLIDYDGNLKNIYISGEISNFTNHYRTGHFYFTLKDEKSAIKAVMFRSSAERVRFAPENGMKVIIRGNISVFERDGVYQLYAEDMQPDGAGALNLAYEQLKNKLAALGMFDEENKKPIPAYPSKIGVITSETGAAVHDILSVLERRYPLAEVVFEGVAVQGDGAAVQIASAIEKFNLAGGADVLIVGRGGGSIEDLWAFNEEVVACAIYNSEIPVISAVGHETDFTIADFVSDLRAPTPSAAAELAVPDYRDLLYTIDKTMDSLSEKMDRIISNFSFEVMQKEKMLFSLNPLKQIQSKEEKLSFLSDKLENIMKRILDKYENKLSVCAVQLETLSPLKIISKGYGISRFDDGKTISSAKQIKKGEKFNILFGDGTVYCTADEVELMTKGIKS